MTTYVHSWLSTKENYERSEQNPRCLKRRTALGEMETERPVAVPEVQGYDRLSELKAFDETKSGVKGLVDNGISKVPRIFLHPPELLDGVTDAPKESRFSFPVVDLGNLDKERRKVVEEIRDAAASWGFFLAVNHGIPEGTMEEMVNGVRRFFEQDDEVKKQYYVRDALKKVSYVSNFDLYRGRAAGWRDSIFLTMAPESPQPEELPSVCRDIAFEYSKKSTELGCTLLELLAEGLGLKPGRLLDMDCAEGLSTICHYYPPCPEPHLTLGCGKHSDNNFLTVLLQDDLGGLQVLHEGEWVDVPPTPGALVINIGDFLQIMSNDKYKSVEHRVLANKAGPRVSVACFFTTGPYPIPKLYGPLDELLSEDNPPKYRSFTVKEYADHFRTKGLGGARHIDHFRL